MGTSLAALTLLVLLAACASAADPPLAERPLDQAGESLAAWQWYHEIAVPKAADSRWINFILSPAVFDKARTDLGDLRLYDGRGRELPYALRVRSARDENQEIPSGISDRRTLADGAIEFVLDLRDNNLQYHQVELSTAGSDFVRRVAIESSADGRTWGFLAAGTVVHLTIEGKLLEVRRLRIPPSRYRYLRLRVSKDPGRDRGELEIRGATVWHTVTVPGEELELPLSLPARQAVPTPSGPGSAWLLDLGGDQVPCERLVLDIADADFARPFVLERQESSGVRVRVASGELRRRAGTDPKPIEIRCDSEVRAQRLRLSVTDNRNPPLNIRSVRCVAAARQLVVETKAAGVGPLRLYVGNPKAEPPRYDFATNLAPVLDPKPARAYLGVQQLNPEYRPEPKPLTERWPWLPYVVLSIASVVLALLLFLLACAALRRQDAAAAVQ